MEDIPQNTHSRAPHGARGLKQVVVNDLQHRKWSRPARGAWIETEMLHDDVIVWSSRAPHGARGLKLYPRVPYWIMLPSRPARGAWIETSTTTTSHGCVTSRPARGAWIETCMSSPCGFIAVVAPRTGRVD